MLFVIGLLHALPPSVPQPRAGKLASEGFSKELVSLESGKNSMRSHQSQAPGEAPAFKDP